MSSPFQKKFSAKDPVKGLTMAQLERKSKKEKELSEKQFEKLGNPSMGDQEFQYDSKDPQNFPGDDGHD